MRVSPSGVKEQADELRDELLAATARVLDSGWFVLGHEVEAFEREFAAWSGSAHAVGVASGTDALTLALRACGVGAGHEVIVPSNALPAAYGVAATGARLRFADVRREDLNIDPAEVERLSGPRTSAVLAVHLYGHPADVEELARAVDRERVAIVEDCAQAHGATLRGRRVGTLGDAAAWSFYPTKNLGGIGDGGAVVTDDGDLAGRVRRLRVHGMTQQYVHVETSQNHRMSELEAAWLRLVLPDLAAGNARRRQIAGRYRAAAPHLSWHADHPDHVHHLCVVRSGDRERFRRSLADAGVATAIHYPLALTQQPAYRHLARRPCPRAEAWAAECVSLPCFPELRDDEVERVCKALTFVPG